ncbi:MAG: hypothetical protein BWY87_00780 [Deltaproteobacteria bacterium ADurb.Bin510]|nr:MAG: hypothetical protein BWY87_00780 [Deltaproteobacteria bacterium ADurb.Bin510]
MAHVGQEFALGSCGALGLLLGFAELFDRMFARQVGADQSCGGLDQFEVVLLAALFALRVFQGDHVLDPTAQAQGQQQKRLEAKLVEDVGSVLIFGAAVFPDAVAGQQWFFEVGQAHGAQGQALQTFSGRQRRDARRADLHLEINHQAALFVVCCFQQQAPAGGAERDQLGEAGRHCAGLVGQQGAGRGGQALLDLEAAVEFQLGLLAVGDVEQHAVKPFEFVALVATLSLLVDPAHPAAGVDDAVIGHIGFAFAHALLDHLCEAGLVVGVNQVHVGAGRMGVVFGRRIAGQLFHVVADIDGGVACRMIAEDRARQAVDQRPEFLFAFPELQGALDDQVFEVVAVLAQLALGLLASGDVAHHAVETDPLAQHHPAQRDLGVDQAAVEALELPLEELGPALDGRQEIVQNLTGRLLAVGLTRRRDPDGIHGQDFFTVAAQQVLELAVHLQNPDAQAVGLVLDEFHQQDAVRGMVKDAAVLVLALLECAFTGLAGRDVAHRGQDGLAAIIIDTLEPHLGIEAYAAQRLAGLPFEAELLAAQDAGMDLLERDQRVAGLAELVEDVQAEGLLAVDFIELHGLAVDVQDPASFVVDDQGVVGRVEEGSEGLFAGAQFGFGLLALADVAYRCQDGLLTAVVDAVEGHLNVEELAAQGFAGFPLEVDRLAPADL